jgi:hypothetical protein
MINYFFEKAFFYRSYQNLIRKKNNDYVFLKYIFKNIRKKINILDVGCGDSYILKYIDPYINTYIGLDYNKNYLVSSKKKSLKYKFYNCDIDNIKILNQKNLNFIFINGVIHHLNDEKVVKLITYLYKNFPRSMFLIIDPVKKNNNFLNKLMIKYDRGKFIRTENKYKILLKNFKSYVINDFFLMNFLLIFHYKNIDLKKFYLNWKRICN